MNQIQDERHGLLLFQVFGYLVGSNTRMGSEVRFEVVRSAEGLLAFIASVWFHNGSRRSVVSGMNSRGGCI